MPIVNSEKALRTVKSRQTSAMASPEKATFTHTAIGALPIIACNAVAIVFQLRFAEAAFGHNLIISILFAISVESTAIGVAFHSHKARKIGLRSGGLFLASVFIGLCVGILNGSHEFHTSIALAACAFAASILSPFLWHMHSVSVSSPELIKNGYLEGASIRLGFDRWFYHPLLSFKTKRAVSWSGERNLYRAIQHTDKMSADHMAGKAAAKASANFDSELDRIQ
jgi:hypothetical protein